MRVCWSVCAAFAVLTAHEPIRAADELPEDEQTLKAAKVEITDEGLLQFFRRRTVADADRRR